RSDPDPAHRRNLTLLHRSDRLGVRARRHHSQHVEGIRRRRGGAREDRGILRGARRAKPRTRAGAHVMTDLSFEVTGARVDPYAASPSILLRVAVTEGSGARVDAIALRAQIRLEVAR